MVDDTIIPRLGALIGKQRDDDTKRINFGTQARQTHLFFSQHFVDVFHEPPSWAKQGPKICSRVEMCFLLRLDYGDSNTHIWKPPCSKPLLCSFTLSVISKPVDPEGLLRLDGILPDGEVHVWQVDQFAWEKETGALFELLDSEERERAARFKFPEPRNQFVISRALLRQCLGRYLHIEAREVRFRTSANGKPELGDPHNELRFNLSHTQGVTAFAVTRNRQVGIDVERIRQDTNALQLAERFFSAQEVDWLRSQSASEHVAAFFSCWTAKEAYIKAHGQGLSMPLSSFGVLPVAGAGSALQLSVYDDPQESRRWSIWELNLGQTLRAALAVEGAGCRVRLGQWPSPDVEVGRPSLP